MIQKPQEKRSLFHRITHQHTPRNVNDVHAAELENAGFNQQVAVRLTRVVGTMWAAYTFTVLALVGLLAILGVLSPTIALLVAWTSQTLIQLVMLPIIMVGQNVLGRKSELQADEQFATTQRSYYDIEQVMQHLSKQDEELLRQTKALEEHTQMLLAISRVLLKAAEKSDAKME